MTGVWIHGLSGKMGQSIRAELQSQTELVLLGGSDSRTDVSSSDLSPIQLFFDFSTTTGNDQLYSKLTSVQDRAVLIGTTGLSTDKQLEWEILAKNNRCRVLFAPNTSIGVLIFRRVLKFIAPVLLRSDFDCEILESHHRNKLDTPSGTAISLLKVVQSAVDYEGKFSRTGKRTSKEIGIASLRGGNVIGEHDVQFLGDLEEFHIKHRALDRRLFAVGALRLGKWLIKQPSGSYSLDDIELEQL